MNTYQLAVVVKNDLDEKARTELLSGITAKFAKLVKEDMWGTRNLSYQIKHNEKGFYAYYEFESEPKDILVLDRNIRLNEDVLRYLLVRSAKPKAPFKKD